MTLVLINTYSSASLGHSMWASQEVFILLDRLLVLRKITRFYKMQTRCQERGKTKQITRERVVSKFTCKRERDHSFCVRWLLEVFHVVVRYEKRVMYQ